MEATDAQSAESLQTIIARMSNRFEQEDKKTPPVRPGPGAPRARQRPVVAEMTEFIQAETFLENIGYFTPSSKRIKGIYVKERVIKTITLPDGTQRTLTVKISANHELGLPYTSDFDYYRAVQRILDETVDEKGRIQQPVVMPTKKLLRYANKPVSSITVREVREFLQRSVLTGIIGAIYQARHKNFIDGITVTLFNQVVFRGERLKSGEIADTNYGWVAPWYLSNIFYRNTRPVDYALHQRLRKPIAKSLYALLSNGWYASNGKPYAKSYAALCSEFLLSPHNHLSKIKQQLNPSHEELRREEYLERWEYRKASQGNDYVITYHPGARFYRSQQEFQRRKELASRIALAEGEGQSGQLELVDGAGILLSDILAICGDTENAPAYRKLIGTYPESLLRMALSETRQAHLGGRISKSRGAYFTDTAHRLEALRQQVARQA